MRGTRLGDCPKSFGLQMKFLVAFRTLPYHSRTLSKKLPDPDERGGRGSLAPPPPPPKSASEGGRGGCRLSGRKISKGRNKNDGDNGFITSPLCKKGAERLRRIDLLQISGILICSVVNTLGAYWLYGHSFKSLFDKMFKLAYRPLTFLSRQICQHWLRQCFWNYLNWDEICLYIVTCLIMGIDYQVSSGTTMFLG